MQNFLSLMAENTFAIIIAVMGFLGALPMELRERGCRCCTMRASQ